MPHDTVPNRASRRFTGLSTRTPGIAPSKRSTISPPSGGGGEGIGPGAGVLGLGALTGGLNAFFGGRQQARESENQYNQQIAMDRALNPNRPLSDALTRNFRGNFLENLGLTDPGQFGKGGVPDAFFQSLRGGINPKLLEEYRNIAGVPGLRVGGQLVGENPEDFYKAKKPGFFESLASGAAGIFGG